MNDREQQLAVNFPIWGKGSVSLWVPVATMSNKEIDLIRDVIVFSLDALREPADWQQFGVPCRSLAAVAGYYQ